MRRQRRGGHQRQKGQDEEMEEVAVALGVVQLVDHQEE
jgi:hypothetical protein